MIILKTYIRLFRQLCKIIGESKRQILVYLAAAVSDFYVPEEEMVIMRLHWDYPFWD